MSAWDKIDHAHEHSRLPAITARPPDYVMNAEGFNDQVCTKYLTSKAVDCTNLGLELGKFTSNLQLLVIYGVFQQINSEIACDCSRGRLAARNALCDWPKDDYRCPRPVRRW